MKLSISALLLAFLVPLAPSARAAARPVKPHFNHVVWIVLENESNQVAMQQPFLKMLAQRGAYFSKFHAEIHPSQPNYIAMMAGSNFGILWDLPVNLNVSHLGDLLESHGRTWKVYAEGYPSPCFLGKTSGLYARKHVPFLSFTNVSQNPKRCANIVPPTTFDQDVQTGHLPDFAMYTPDLNDDGHNTSVAYADKWLQKRMGQYLGNRAFMNDTIFIITFDEDDWFNDNHIYTIIYGANIPANTVLDKEYNHYSLLRLIEDEWGLGTLGRKDSTANIITGIWH